MCMLKKFPFSSSIRLRIPITSRSAVVSTIYLASVVLSAIKYCILLSHIIGQPAYIIMYPVHKWLDKRSSDDR